MGAIHGLFRFDDAPVSDADLEVMRRPMAQRGPAGHAAWREGSLGLGSLLRHNTPEAVHESQPQRSADGRLMLVATAVGLLGHSGAGKSTLAVALARRGCRVLADDVLAVTWLDGVPHACPG